MVSSPRSAAAKRLVKLADTLNPKSEVIKEELGDVGTLILNRPQAYNSLNLNMVRIMTPHIQEWEESDRCKMIILKSNQPNVFCSGGDLKYKHDFEYCQKMFKETYELIYKIATLRTPLVGLIDGIVMGAGAGLTVQAPFRIATERSVFSMPETRVGFYPDVGAAWFLPRLDGFLGRYLGLTGTPLKGKEVFWAGIATHFVNSQQLPALVERLQNLSSSDFQMINQTIEEFADASSSTPSVFNEVRPVIDRCFNHRSIKDVIAALEQETEMVTWAKQTIKTLRKMSPTSLAVTLEQLNRGEFLSLSQCFKLEYHLTLKFLDRHDFEQGVNAIIYKKSKEPEWKPRTIEELDDNSIITEYFSQVDAQALPLPDHPPYNPASRTQFALPTEQEVLEYYKSQTKPPAMSQPTLSDLLTHFLDVKKNKVGVKTKVTSIVNLNKLHLA